jgi:exonuclease SbcD
MGIKIFHTADLHLGMKFTRGYPEEVQQSLIQARFDTLRDIVEKANKEGSDIFVIAGDLFDSQKLAKKDALLAADILKGFDGLVLILPGNHDSFQKEEDTLWARFRGAMGEQTLILGDPVCRDLRPFGLDIMVYPAPCTAKHSDTNGIGWIREVPKDPEVKHHIGIAHGSLEGLSPDFNGDYYPMRQDELGKSGIDLWLMGHTHLRYPDRETGTEGKFFFPSTPEPDGFDCSHSGYAWIIDLNKDKSVSYRSVETGRYRFMTLDDELNREEDVEGLKFRFEKLNRERHLVKLKLKGRVPGVIYDERAALLEELREKVLYLECDLSELMREITVKDIDREFTEGSFPHRMLRELAEKQKNPFALQMAYELIREVKS